MSKINPQNKVLRDNLKKVMPDILRGYRGQWGYTGVLDFKFLHMYSTIKGTGLQINCNGEPMSAMSYDKAMEYASLKEFNVNYGGNQMGKLWGRMVDIPGFPYMKAFITWSKPLPDKGETAFYVYEFSTGMKLWAYPENSSQEAIRLAARNTGSMIKNESEFRSFVDNVIKMYGVKNV